VIGLAIDTSTDVAGLALSEDGELLAELTWRSQRNHSRQLLPTLELLLGRLGLSRSDLGAIYVCVGPGSYAGLRVGVSTAKALAYGLSLPLVGVGRLAADASPLAATGGPAVYAVQAAGRADLAWAAYSRRGDGLIEAVAPRLGPAASLVEAIRSGAIACGEIDAGLAEALAAKGVARAAASASRVVSVAVLGYDRLRAGDLDDADSLVPVYLREPAIGPQPPHSPDSREGAVWRGP
jgi:tRNA threonylcarbamoyladenosine biosynthesis protein TsaB